MEMPIPILFTPERLSDARGWFSETYKVRTARRLGIEDYFVQDNQSLSLASGTLRGFHFQAPPHPQCKLVRCVVGRIFDVAVDVRRGSPTWGRAVTHELSAKTGSQLYVPVGFAHAFLTLEPNCEVVYKVTDVYAPECDRGIRFDSVGIEWPIAQADMVLSDKDRSLPALANLESPFLYDGNPLPERVG